VGDRRARVAVLTQPRRQWPLVVRRARAADREAVLAFASATWDGWDYVPHAWPVWLTAADGVLLVAVAGAPADGSAPLDNAGRPLEIGRPLALARVALTSPEEVWLEGIRVDPRVRAMDVATDLQAAELAWAVALGGQVVRYATGERNEGSHRLGARHGFRLVASFRTYWWSESEEQDDDEDDSGFGPGARTAADELRRATLGRLARMGQVVKGRDAARWWATLSGAPTFLAGGGLYEHRAWALQSLTAEAFSRHVERGEVLATGDERGWALALLERSTLPAEDASLHVGLLAGNGGPAVRLLTVIQQAAGESIRFRLPVNDPAIVPSHADALAAAGFHAREWTLDILERPLDADHPPPAPTSPAALVLEEAPANIARPPG
jgi:hypothetical protein